MKLEKSIQNGFILLNKPAGITSFNALNKIKTALKIRKVGHIGTLDKFANGLLGVLTGCYTRMVPYFSVLDKEYIAEIYFGKRTDTLDPEGEIIEEKDVPDISTVKTILKEYIGELDQVPPIFSAVHHNGSRAYKLARKGRKPELNSRKITIHELEMLSYVPPVLKLRVLCSKGTYIRALARDIAKDCKSCAYLTDLKRTIIGPFLLKDAVKPDEFNPERDLHLPYNFIKLLNEFEVCKIKEDKKNKILNGDILKDDYFEACPNSTGKIAVFDNANRLIGIVNRGTGKYSYITVFNLE